MVMLHNTTQIQHDNSSISLDFMQDGAQVLTGGGDFGPPPGGGGLGFVHSPHFNQHFVIQVVPQALLNLCSDRIKNLLDIVLDHLFFQLPENTKLDPKTFSDLTSTKMDIPFHPVESVIQCYGALTSVFGQSERTLQVIAWANDGNIQELSNCTVSELKKIPIQDMVQGGHVAVLRLMHERGLQIMKWRDKTGGDISHVAAANNQVDVLRLIHSFGFGINAKPNSRGYYPAYLAIKEGHIDILQYLDSLGITYDVCVKRTFFGLDGGKTPMHLAAWSTPALIEHLAKKGFSVLSGNKKWQSSFHAAIHMFLKDLYSPRDLTSVVLCKLLTNFQSLKSFTQDGETPVHFEYIAHQIAENLAERFHEHYQMYQSVKSTLQLVGFDFSAKGKRGKSPDSHYFEICDRKRALDELSKVEPDSI